MAVFGGAGVKGRKMVVRERGGGGGEERGRGTYIDEDPVSISN